MYDFGFVGLRRDQEEAAAGPRRKRRAETFNIWRASSVRARDVIVSTSSIRAAAVAAVVVVDLDPLSRQTRRDAMCVAFYFRGAEVRISIARGVYRRRNQTCSEIAKWPPDRCHLRIALCELCTIAAISTIDTKTKWLPQVSCFLLNCKRMVILKMAAIIDSMTLK